jgi:hypothetical protein
MNKYLKWKLVTRVFTFIFLNTILASAKADPLGAILGVLQDHSLGKVMGRSRWLSLALQLAMKSRTLHHMLHLLLMHNPCIILNVIITLQPQELTMLSLPLRQ